ncbi:hypothetical protein, partial [Clostridium perfringens]|uniref:hypothetical protein n=1 Tax=Clostridium perfringens TaxID=1502 RepID=UPI001A7E2B04
TLASLVDKVIRIEEAIFPSTPRPQSNEPPVPFAFFCDINARDHNGAVLDELKEAFRKKFPIITSAGLLNSVGMETPTSHVHVKSEFDAYEI